MTPEAKRTAIAEWCGWKHRESFIGSYVGGFERSMYNPESGRSNLKIPDYLNDYNSMIGALRDTICGDKELEVRFLKELRLIHERVTDSEDVTPICEWDMVLVVSECDWLAEAMLRAIGKWTEELEPKEKAE